MRVHNIAFTETIKASRTTQHQLLALSILLFANSESLTHNTKASRDAPQPAQRGPENHSELRGGLCDVVRLFRNSLCGATFTIIETVLGCGSHRMGGREAGWVDMDDAERVSQSVNQQNILCSWTGLECPLPHRTFRSLFFLHRIMLRHFAWAGWLR